MSAYVIVEVDVLDDSRVAEYRALAVPSIERYGGSYLVQTTDVTAAEGAWSPSLRLVVLEFPDLDRAKRWYSSPEYTKAIEVRAGTMDLRMLFAEGVPA